MHTLNTHDALSYCPASVEVELDTLYAAVDRKGGNDRAIAQVLNSLGIGGWSFEFAGPRVSVISVPATFSEAHYIWQQLVTSDLSIRAITHVTN